jgi:hypothetical protein
MLFATLILPLRLHAGGFPAPCRQQHVDKFSLPVGRRLPVVCIHPHGEEPERHRRFTNK